MTACQNFDLHAVDTDAVTAADRHWPGNSGQWTITSKQYRQWAINSGQWACKQWAAGKIDITQWEVLEYGSQRMLYDVNK